MSLLSLILIGIGVFVGIVSVWVVAFVCLREKEEKPKEEEKKEKEKKKDEPKVS